MPYPFKQVANSESGKSGTSQLPRKILIRCPNWIGDHVMALGFYRNVRQYYKDASITWLMRDLLTDLRFPELCDEVLVIPEESRKIGRPFFSFARVLRAKGYHLSISLPATLSSSLLFWLSGIPERVGFASDGNDLFYTSSVKWKGRDAGKHKAELYLDLAEFLTHQRGGTVVAANSSSPSKKIVMAPGASIPLREWPYYEELCERLLERDSSLSIVFVGAKESRAWHERLVGKPRVTDLIEKTTLTELVELCCSASCVIANDSGVAHVAATLAGAKTFVLFGPGDPRYIAPQGKVTAVRLENLPCSPCEKPYCRAPFGYQKCLKDLRVDSALKLLDSFLS